MTVIIPRWEWRTFGKRINLTFDPQVYPRWRHSETSETYLLSDRCSVNPKTRDGKIDVKILQQVDEDGFERWKPVMNEAFPLIRERIQYLFTVLRITLPPLTQPRYSETKLLQRLQGTPLRPLAVSKVRDQYNVDACGLEVATVTVTGNSLQTVAVEHTDPLNIKALVRKLGLQGRKNMNYVVGLKAVHEGRP